MPKHPEYEIEFDPYWPPRRYGRYKSINNDDELIARGAAGYISGQYKSYSAAAKALAPESLTYVKRKWQRVGDIASIIDRLRREISKAYKLSLQTLPTDKK